MIKVKDVKKLLATLETVCKEAKFILINVHTNQLTIKNTFAVEDLFIELNSDFLIFTMDKNELELDLNCIKEIIYENDEVEGIRNICTIEMDTTIVYLDYI
jgi:hypothetical protein